jgi:hypothetical protein
MDTTNNTGLITILDAPQATGIGGRPATTAVDPLSLVKIDDAKFESMLETMSAPLMTVLAKVTGQGAAELQKFAGAVLPEMARLTIISQAAPDGSLRMLAQRQLDHLRTQALLDAARYGVSLLQGAQKSALAVFDTALLMGVQSIGVAIV